MFASTKYEDAYLCICSMSLFGQNTGIKKKVATHKLNAL
jgi:hypothetical protein